MLDGRIPITEQVCSLNGWHPYGIHSLFKSKHISSLFRDCLNFKEPVKLHVDFAFPEWLENDYAHKIGEFWHVSPWAYTALKEASDSTRPDSPTTDELTNR